MDVSGFRFALPFMDPKYASSRRRAVYSVALVVFIFLFCFSPNSSAQTPYYVWTGQTSAQTQIDSFHTSSWYIEVFNGPLLLGGGNFTMKAGSSATADVTLSLYQGSS